MPPEAFSHHPHPPTHAANAGHGPATDTPTGADAEARSHVAQASAPHESPPVMTVPLIVLAVGAVLVGIVFGPTGTIRGVPGPALRGADISPGDPRPCDDDTVIVGGDAASIVFALGGIGIAWWMYVRQPGLAGQLARAMAVAYETSRNKFYFDELYEAIVVQPVTAFAHVLRVFDQYILDGLVDLIGTLPRCSAHCCGRRRTGWCSFTDCSWR